MIDEPELVKKPNLGQNSLILYNKKGELLLRSSGKWLHPLFEVEDFLRTRNIEAKNLILHDKIAGHAAAALIIRMGFETCIINLISQPALDLFEKYNMDCTYTHLVKKIDCRTEDLITSSMDLDSIYKMIRRRAGYSLGISLKIENIRSGYGNKVILKGLNLTLDAGDQLVITGDNGAGKSTLLKTLIGALPLISGEIHMEKGKPMTIGYVTQNHPHSHMPVSAYEIVSIGLLGQKIPKKEKKNRIEIAMRQTGCFHLRKRDINSLSGGENQRVALARCLCQKAGLFLLDEPTSYLDQKSKDELLVLLNEIVISSSPTVLMVSHDHQWLEKLGWNTALLKNGRLSC